MDLNNERILLLNKLKKAILPRDIRDVIDEYISNNKHDPLCEFLPTISKMHVLDIHNLVSFFDKKKTTVRDIIEGSNPHCLFSIDGKLYSFAGINGDEYFFTDRSPCDTANKYKLIKIDLDQYASMLF